MLQTRTISIYRFFLIFDPNIMKSSLSLNKIPLFWYHHRQLCAMCIYTDKAKQNWLKITTNNKLNCNGNTVLIPKHVDKITISQIFDTWRARKLEIAIREFNVREMPVRYFLVVVIIQLITLTLIIMIITFN